MNGPAIKMLTQIGAKKKARMFFSLIYFFAPFSIFYIPHNYVIPQAPCHSANSLRFLPSHRTWYTLLGRNWKELANLKNISNKKIEIQMLNVRGDVYVE